MNLQTAAKPLNILHLSAVKSWGGGGNHIENLCYELGKNNPEITNIIVVTKNGQFHERLKKSSFHYDTLPLGFNLDPRAISKFIKICRKNKIDLVHIHGPSSLTIAVIASHFARLPPMILSKKTSFPIKKRKQTLWKYNHDSIKKILCVSEKTKAIAAEAIADKAKLKTIYHGTRFDNKSTDTPFTLREKYAIPALHKIVGNIGNHIKAKDLHTWIDTIDYIVNDLKITNITFVQIGTFSDESAQYLKKVEDLNLKKFVHFLGYVPNASNFMPQFDTLFITSKAEGLPQVIYEAFYHGIPVVSTNVGGIPELIVNAENGFISKPGDFKTLAENLLKVLDNKALLEKFTHKSREKLFPRFTAENMAKETLSEYRKALKLN